MSRERNGESPVPTGDIQAVSRTAQILGLFTPIRPMVTVAEGAALLGLNRTTTSRYFSSLESAGLLTRNADQPSAYEPGRLLMQLGAFALGRRRVDVVAPPLMRDLSVRTHLTVVLSLWGIGGPVVVHSEDHSDSGASISVRTGTQLPISSAQAHVFMAFHKDNLLVERMLSTLDSQDRHEMEERLAHIRTMATVQRVSNHGVSIFAAPIFNAGGICAAVALLGTTVVLPLDNSARESALLMETAKEITTLMGGEWSVSDPTLG